MYRYVWYMRSLVKSIFNCKIYCEGILEIFLLTGYPFIQVYKLLLLVGCGYHNPRCRFCYNCCVVVNVLKEA